MKVHDKNAPISQPSTSSQEASGGSKKSDLKSVGGSLGSELSNLNLQDKNFHEASQGGVVAATAQACGNNHQGALGVSCKPPSPNTSTSRDGITRSEQTYTQVPNMPDPANNNGGVSTDPNIQASGDGMTHSKQTHTQVSNMPNPGNADGGVVTDLNSQAAGDDITHSEETHSQVLNAPDPVNADEASRDDSNQERNAATAGRTEAPNRNQQQASVPVAAAAAAAAAEAVPPHPVGTNLESLTGTPIQEESVDTVDEGATSNETAPSEEEANCYDQLYGK